MGDPRRAAGTVLRSLRRPGARGIAEALRGEPLRPSLAAEAIVAAARAHFDLAEEAAKTLFAPALSDWRDAVGCSDPLLVPANAQGEAAEKHLVPLPLPSWCAHLVDMGVLHLHGPPRLEGPRVVQRAVLLAVRESELSAVECFPVVFAGRFGFGAAAPEVHLALSPSFLAEGWRGTVCLRAAAHGPAGAEPRNLRIWVGPPASPGAAPAGAAGTTVATWAVLPGAQPSSEGASWPAGWPRWAVLRLLEGREPQALWDLASLWHARVGAVPEASPGGPAKGAAPGTMRIAIDVGSTSTVVVEEDSAAAGSVGTKLLGAPSRRPVPSGFRLLAGDPRTAHRYGCAGQLLAPAGQVPTALAAASLDVLGEILGKESAIALDQLWLPQAPEERNGDDVSPPVLADRFKSPDLLLLSDWLAEVPGAPAPAHASRRLLKAYGYLLGRTLAAAHAAPLVTPEGGRWTLRWPRLSAVETVLTYPPCTFAASSQEPFRDVFDEVGREVCRGLEAAWASSQHRMVADPTAARAARPDAADPAHPIEAIVDFGGLTLQITVRVPASPGRPAPFVAGSSMGYLLGGERLIDAAAFASAALDSGSALRDAYRATARKWRGLIASGGHLRDGEREAASAFREAVLDTAFSLLRRQLEGTLRRAAPDLRGLRGAGVRLYLLGEGWKLVALDTVDDEREAAALATVSAYLHKHPLLTDAEIDLSRMTKRRLCEGALRVHVDEASSDEPLELQGVDVAGGQKRWFGIAGTGAEPRPAPDPSDPWWQSFVAGTEGSLLRVEQWFTSPAPFETDLCGGPISFDPRRSLLKQWIDLSGPSLVALRIHGDLAERPQR
ncbi:MAG: hypothetical protein ACJ78U_13860 [Myxococcales bacterium]